jgi:hypothetical protein
MELPIQVIPSEAKPKDKRLEQMKYRESLPAHPANVCILGRCGSGKSCWLWSALNHGYVDAKGKSVFDEILVYLGTMDAVDAFKNLPCDNIAVMNEFDPEAFMTYLEDLKAHQMERLSKGKPPLNICIVFDDFAGKSLMKPMKKGGSSPLEHLLITSRHEASASIFYCSQAYKNNGFSTPIARNNMTHYVIYSMGRAEMEKVAEEHCGDMTEEQFLDWYFKVMKTKHNFIMINYKKPIEERYTERFTTIYRPGKSIERLDDARKTESSIDGDTESGSDVRPTGSEADDKPANQRRRKRKEKGKGQGTE